MCFRMSRINKFNDSSISESSILHFKKLKTTAIQLLGKINLSRFENQNYTMQLYKNGI